MGARSPSWRSPTTRGSATRATSPPRSGRRAGDGTPSPAFAAVIAAGLHGIEHGLELPPPLEGNAYESDAERFPHSLREAIASLEGGTVARGAFGDQVVDHSLHYPRTEHALL